ncbi:Xaa-Pro peptidase family protein [Corynebacterium sp. p3-SID1145]|uniref:M24 family metallopeptidase n=1 Tax=unclassified Corynebacterium TaxID=2624378 RepID=UPI0021A9D9D7|nr:MULTISPECIES: Xaa-Pro peptidase family protein [unclassified Corynebacterium]MCT1452350.1 Xaa-Pro peptidase family protein [Corynebacterium sp. p3-SID1145]MCT1461254.1 Xaa-Pro peptidase family protein [Corynebacterium sp. p3-SID1140]
MSFADSRFLTRRRKLSAKLAAQRIDSFLLTDPTNVRYFSGFSGSNGALLMNKDLSAAIATDGRYTTQIAEEVPDIDAIIEREAGTAILATVPEGWRVGFDPTRVTVDELERLDKATPDSVALVPVKGVVEQIRLLKDSFELHRLEDAAKIAVDALAQLIDAGELRAGRTEKEVAADLEHRMRLLGSERVSFDTIVASGPNSALPHYAAGDRELTDGDLVTIDFGAHYVGFNSDMTRTFCIGEPSDFNREIYEIVLQAQKAGVAAATPGRPLVDVDKACRDIITEAGYGDYFVHSTGHGIGLEVHEGPAASTRAQGVLEENMTLTIEPGIYVPGKGGVRIEDTLIITSGAPKVITPAPKELTIL